MDDIILEIFVFDNYIERSAEEIVAKFSLARMLFVKNNFSHKA